MVDRLKGSTVIKGFIPQTDELGSLTIEETLFYADGPRLFTARAAGTLFLAVCTDEDEPRLTLDWIYAELNQLQLDAIHDRSMPLRDVFTFPSGALYRVKTSFHDSIPDTATAVNPAELLDSELPIPGAIL